MKRIFTLCLAVMSFSLSLFGEADYVYHERTTNVHCGGIPYVSNLTPTSAQSVNIAFKINFQNYWNQARIYYTTDGSTPSGAFGTGTGTTLVITATYQCGAGGGLSEEIVRGTIPAQTAGTVVKYIVSAWHTGGGDEIFGNGCGNCGTESRPASNATVFVTSATLPVSLLEFSSKSKENKNILSWLTASEKNAAHFDIQRSNDNTAWSSIGQVKAVNNTYGSDYQFIDAQPLSGTNYYRLQMVDANGSTELSKIVAVNASTGNKSFKIYPNPAKDILTIVTDANTEGVSIFDINGRLVMTVVVKNQNVNIQKLTSGVYFVRMMDKTGFTGSPVRFVKQ